MSNEPKEELSNLEPSDFISGSTYMYCLQMERELSALKAENERLTKENQELKDKM